MKKIVISNRQLMLITATTGYMPFITPTLAFSESGRDAWISVILASIIGLLVVWVNIHLAEIYPEKTFVEFTQQLLGKWVGGFISLCLIIVQFISGIGIIWYIGNFFTTMYLTRASVYSINILYVAVITIALLYGLESIARTIEILFIITLTFYIAVVISLIFNYNFSNILPIMENGITPVIEGVLPIMNDGVFPVISLTMIFTSNIEDIKGAKIAIYKGYFLGFTVMLIAILMCIMVLGNMYNVLRFPLFEITKMINVDVVFSRVEALIIVVWLSLNFFSSVIYFYASILGVSQILKLKSYKSITIPILFIATVYSGFIYKNTPNQLNWDKVVRTPKAIVFGFVLPLILLIISWIKKKKKKADCNLL